jgi:hypothetical protein
LLGLVLDFVAQFAEVAPKTLNGIATGDEGDQGGKRNQAPHFLSHRELPEPVEIVL